MKMRKSPKKILVGITGRNAKQLKEKIEEIDKFKISEASLFLEQLNKPQRKKIYKILLNSGIKKIPMIHIRNDMTRKELEFLYKKYHRPLFAIHESAFKYLEKWRGFHKNLYLEMHCDNYIPNNVKVEEIGGFCIDLAHFKAEKERKLKEFGYIMERKNKKQYFKCNHLSGYSYKGKRDLHTIHKLGDFDYLKTLPEFLFGNIMAIEVYNTIAEQLEFKKYLIKILNLKTN